MSVLGDLVVQYDRDELPIATGRAQWSFPRLASFDAPVGYDAIPAAATVAGEVMARVAVSLDALRSIRDAANVVLGDAS